MEENKIPDFLFQMLVNKYGEKNTDEILDGYKQKRFTTLRVNTIKSNVEEIKNELKNNKIEFQRVEWFESAFVLKNANEQDIKELDIYKQGKIYMQSLSSMLPPIILEPKEKEDILDMTAAPGGKTTELAALSDNKSHITACEKNKIRAERLKYNVEKQGATNVFVMQKDSRNIDYFFKFDKILLDAPCSGSGTLNVENQNIEKIFTKQLVERSSKVQFDLLKKAIKLLKKGNEMVYSTCSILSCENEEIVQKILKTENVEVVPIEFEGMETLPKLPVNVPGTLCIKPDEYYEGFYVAKLRKK